MTSLRVDRRGTLIDIRELADLTGQTYDAARARHQRGQLLAPAGRIGPTNVWWADEALRWNAAGRPTREAWAGAVLPRHR